MFPCVCRVIDHGRPHNVVKKSLTLSAAPRVPRFYSNHIWRHLWLITKQTYGNTESISLKAHVLDYLKRSGLFPWSVMGKKTSKLDKVAVTHMLVFSTLSNPRLLRVYSFSVDFYLLPQKNMSRFYFNNKKKDKNVSSGRSCPYNKFQKSILFDHVPQRWLYIQVSRCWTVIITCLT